MNDLDLCLEVVSRSRQPLRYIWRWISRKPLEIEVWFQRTTNGIWAIEWLRDRWRHVTLKGQTRDPNTLRAQYLENCLIYRLQIWYAALYRAGTQIIFLESGRGLGHVTTTIFGSTVGYPSDSLASCLQSDRNVCRWPLSIQLLTSAYRSWRWLALDCISA